jgi:hypothetical protein
VLNQAIDQRDAKERDALSKRLGGPLRSSQPIRAWGKPADGSEAYAVLALKPK